MNERGIEDVINTLFEMVQEARGVPLSADKCILEREKVLDLLDEILNQLPGELKQAKTIVESRGEVVNNAKREAENILRQAQAQAREMVSESEIYNQANQEAEEMIQAAREEAEKMVQTAQDRIRELKQLTNDYVDDALRRTEESIAEALGDIKETRVKFSAVVGAQNKPETTIKPTVVEEVE